MTIAVTAAPTLTRTPGNHSPMKRNNGITRHQIRVNMRIVRAALLIVSAAIAPAFAAAPAWDTSGNGQLNGSYYFRQVVYVSDASGNTSRAVTLFGNITFNGSVPGTYTLSGITQQDSGGGFQIPSTGTYSVSASGHGFLSNPIVSNSNVQFLVSNKILIGSATESGYNDMFVAAPFSSSLSLSSFQGTYTIDAFFIGAAAANSANATFQLSPNAGNLGNVNISGFSGSGTSASQSSSGVKYVYANGAYSIVFPTNNNAFFYQGGTSGNNSGDNGPLFLYMSPDSNFVFGGTQLGFDMFVGVRNGGSNPFSGLYYEAGIEEDTNFGLDTYYGAVNAFQDGGLNTTIEHKRIFYSNSGSPGAEGDTYYNYFPNTNVPVTYTIGQSGIRVGAGTGASLSIAVALPYSPPAPTGSVYIDPTGIVNTASSAPYTAGISPGDFITLYNGVNLASGNVFAPPGAFPTTLGGVTVLIDGIAAPLYYVTPTQISALVPYAVGTYPIASIQVKNSSGASNIATTYVHQTTPGAFTNPSGGIGIAAMLDFPASGGYFIVGAKQPAQPGDYVAMYLTGLGNPFPPNGDGALGGTTCVSGSCLVNDVAIDIQGLDVGTPTFAGLAPGLAGLYQVNFQIPQFCSASLTTGCLNGAGNYNVGITGEIPVTGGAAADSYSDESYIPIGSVSGATAAVREAPKATTMPRARRTSH
jgi:uncharacterized protein (TIGR03437 family)